MSTVDDRTQAPPAPPPRATGRAADRGLSAGRRFWRWLTSMRTALLLLFLLALAAIPGSLLPQRNVNVEKVTAYIADHPGRGRLYDRLSLFDVFSSPWFAAIYLLLFVSLVGCLVPRLRSHVTALLRTPPDAPRRLSRMPAHASGLRRDGEPERVAAALRDLLRGRRFRTALRPGADGGFTVSAEKGYLKETGNLLFHFALLAMLVGVAVGSSYGWHGNRLLVAGPDGAFCDSLQQYDDYGLGQRVSAADLPPFCVQLDAFRATYLDNGQPRSFAADLSYTVGDSATRRRTISVNHPLRLSAANVYLLGHGYAPVVRYTDRYGRAQTTVAPFLPRDGMFTSEGVAAFPDANVDPKTGPSVEHRQQVAFSGIFLPTAPANPMVGHSASPELRDPRLMLVTYRGDLGLDAGIPSSVYTLDQDQIASKRLVKVGQPIMLRPGASARLDDGTTVQFLGVRPFATLSVRSDPGEKIVLGAAGILVLGLLISLTGRRRRFWFRVAPAAGTTATGSGPGGVSGGSLVEAGGLPRSPYAGFEAEFDEIVAAAAGRPADSDVPTEGTR
jgi:cytochrome c biogenesis protein